MLTDTQVRREYSGAIVDTVLNDKARGRGGGSLRLKIRVGVRGKTATWLAWWQQGGKPRTMMLGRYPDLSLADTRKLAAETVSAAKSTAPRAPAPSERTVAKLFDGYVAAMRQAAKVSADDVAGKLARAADALGSDTPAATVTADDVAALLETIAGRGSVVMADRMRAYLSAAFNWGIHARTDYRTPKAQRVDWGIAANPVARVKRDASANVPRERNLSRAELAVVWHAVGGAGFDADTAAAVRLLLCCGQRVMETLRVDGADIDLAAAVWTMPARKTKGGAPHKLPLPPQAVEIFHQLIERYGEGTLFPARLDESDRLRARSVNQALKRWQRLNGFAAFQARDLRRTWKSRAGDAGVDRFTRDLIQQHAQNGDTGSRHYDHADYMPQMREAMAKWSQWLQAAIEVC